MPSAPSPSLIPTDRLSSYSFVGHAMLFAATSNSVMCVKNEHRTLGWDFGLTHTGKSLGGTRRSLSIAAIAMNKHEHHRALRQQNDFASPFARR